MHCALFFPFFLVLDLHLVYSSFLLLSSSHPFPPLLTLGTCVHLSLLTFRLTLAFRHTQEGAFAFVFKSVHFPDEIVACRRGSPVLIGVKTDKKLKVDFVDVEFGTDPEEKAIDRGECKRSRPLPIYLFLC